MQRLSARGVLGPHLVMLPNLDTYYMCSHVAVTVNAIKSQEQHSVHCCKVHIAKACFLAIGFGHECSGLTRPVARAMAANSKEAAMPASVPSALTAPSLPLGTFFRVVIRYVVRP